MKLRSRTARDLLAAEYALGTMAPTARRRFEALASNDRDLRNRLAFWEDHLAWLGGDISLVPPAGVLPRIETELGWRDGGVVQAIGMRIDWRWCIGIALVLLLALWRPWENPFDGAREYMLRDQAGKPGWLVQVQRDGKLLRARARAEHGSSAHDYQLWLLRPRGASPVSFGLLPESSGASVVVPAGDSIDRGLGFLISIERPGGSSTGFPSSQAPYRLMFNEAESEVPTTPGETGEPDDSD